MHKPVGVQVNYCCMTLPVSPVCISTVTKIMPKKANITQTAINSDFVFVQSPVSEAPDVLCSNHIKTLFSQALLQTFSHVT